MDLFEPTRQAFALLFSGDAKLWGIIWISLWVALAAIALIAPFAIGAGFALAKLKFAGRRVIIVLLQSLLSFPTVVIALVLYLLLSRRGPFGAFELPPFDEGTNAVAQTAARLTVEGKLLSVAGGGDTVAAINKFGIADRIGYISTAGGAFLEWLEGKPLPGVEALRA